jgi:type VI secretion system secreted protein Hcp
MAKGDMFLKLDGARQGPIKGEAQDENHKDEIDILAWSWGMHAQSAMNEGVSGGRATLDTLTITKLVDSASSAIMACVRNNEPIKKGVLTVRKAGGSALEYLKVTIEQARITSIDIRSGASDGESTLTEVLQFSFQKIGVEYTPQGKDGLARGSMLFETQIET